MRVLLVEDEKHLADAVASGLGHEGFVVDVAGDGITGQWLGTQNPYDVIVLDIMLPGRNGYDVLAGLRRDGVWAPVLMLTAKDGDLDQVDAFDLGVPIFVSVAGETVRDFAALCERVSEDRRVAAIELNLSCPNVEHGGLTFCAGPAAVDEVVSVAAGDDVVASEAQQVIRAFRALDTIRAGQRERQQRYDVVGVDQFLRHIRIDVQPRDVDQGLQTLGPF